MQCNFPSHLLNANLIAETLYTCKKPPCVALKSDETWLMGEQVGYDTDAALPVLPLLEEQTSKFLLLISLEIITDFPAVEL